MIAEHRQAADRRFTRNLVLDDIPMLGESAILQADDVRSDPRGRAAYIGETPTQHQHISIRHDQTVLVSHRGRGGFDEAEESIPPGRDVRTVLNVVG